VQPRSRRASPITSRRARRRLRNDPGYGICGISDPQLLGAAFVGESWATWRRRSAPPFNPTLPQSVIDAALERDPEVAAAEWLVEWRSDLADFVSREVVDAAVVAGRYKLPPLPGVRYSAFVDPSGGSSDSIMLAMRTMGRMAA
jgi:hypothetical protein